MLVGVSDEFVTASAATIAGSATTPRAEGREARLFLVVYEDAAVRVVDLEENFPVTFGRSRQATVPLEDDKASRLHARVAAIGHEVLVEDLGSTNGTKVNSERLGGDGRPVKSVLRPGDEICIGRVRIVLGALTPQVGGMRIGGFGELEDRLASELDRMRRYHRSAGLAMIRLEGAGSAPALVRMLQGIRRMDFIAEYGPGEYAVLFPETTSEACLAAVQRLASLAIGAELTGADARTRVSFGLASYPSDADGPGELVQCARDSLRHARRDAASGAAASADAGTAKPSTRHSDTQPASGKRVLYIDSSMRRVRELARKVAPTATTVLILGETGAGKEIVAEEIHVASGRAGPFLRLNCSALQDNLVESSLFGHEKGAFTGADKRHVGFFQAADGGTLLLDEIGDISPASQVKLLRVLESHEVTPLGATAPIRVDVRVLAATHHDLEARVREGRFREDLYFRLATFVLYVPPLRERRSEIAPLARLIAEDVAASLGQPQPTLTSEFIAYLEAHHWPGNVRELRNAVERAVVLADAGRLEAQHLPDRLVAAPTPSMPFDIRDGIRGRLDIIERTGILEALANCQHNQTHAARLLGISRRALIYKMRKYKISRFRTDNAGASDQHAAADSPGEDETPV